MLSRRLVQDAVVARWAYSPSNDHSERVRPNPLPLAEPSAHPPAPTRARAARRPYRAESAIRVSIARTRGPDFPRNATKWRSIPAS
jgi:hypothetical protein